MPEISPTTRARSLRSSAPFAERLMWGRLRDRRLAGWKFRRQAPVDRYVVDFLCMEAHLVVELDGGQHSEDEAARRDGMRTAELARMGFRVIRFWNNEVFDDLDAVCATVLATLLNER